ncbi:hypothetical protein BJY59DRAFT_304154 [Rhodotorula toruloides]
MREFVGEREEKAKSEGRRRLRRGGREIEGVADCPAGVPTTCSFRASRYPSNEPCQSRLKQTSPPPPRLLAPKHSPPSLTASQPRTRPSASFHKHKALCACLSSPVRDRQAREVRPPYLLVRFARRRRSFRLSSRTPEAAGFGCTLTCW